MKFYITIQPDGGYSFSEDGLPVYTNDEANTYIVRGELSQWVYAGDFSYASGVMYGAGRKIGPAMPYLPYKAKEELIELKMREAALEWASGIYPSLYDEELRDIRRQTELNRIQIDANKQNIRRVERGEEESEEGDRTKEGRAVQDRPG